MSNIEKHRVEIKNHFAEDERAPLKTSHDLEGLRYFAIDEKYFCECDFVKSVNVKAFDLPTYSGITRPYIEYGKLSCKIASNKINLTVYKNLTYIQNPLYKNHLFLPFKDITSGQETYGGGRYIDLKTDDIVDNKVKVDFNKCYNPWCAYSDSFNCPIPPKENHLSIAISAGEKNYEGTHKVK
jgi:uncharacterized protein